MNPDERFEERLRELARTSVGDGDPTPAWKAEILAAAKATPVSSRSFAPPRPLLVAWAAAWIAIAFLSWSGPDPSDPKSPVADASAAPFPILLANRSELLQQLDLP